MRTHCALSRLLTAAAVVGACLPACSAFAQNSYFGQNQVQYQKFDWRVKKTEHFDVHYYKGMEEASVIAARMAERSYARLSRIMGYTFKERKPIICPALSICISQADGLFPTVTCNLHIGGPRRFWRATRAYPWCDKACVNKRLLLFP